MFTRGWTRVHFSLLQKTNLDHFCLPWPLEKVKRLENTFSHPLHGTHPLFNNARFTGASPSDRGGFSFNSDTPGPVCSAIPLYPGY